MHKPPSGTAHLLEAVYSKYHKTEYLHPDPLEFLSKYKDPGDIEIAGLIASSFATGRVFSILATVDSILGSFKSLSGDLQLMDKTDLEHLFKSFRYRFYSSESLVEFLLGIKETVKEFGSLENCYLEGSVNRKDGETLAFFVSRLSRFVQDGRRVLPDPLKGSACKRLHLFLRWMIRDDDIDPGVWKGADKKLLTVPLDVHMMRISTILGFTERKPADLRTAIEITDALRCYDEEDPVRFDFSLTRLGIHPDLNYDELYSRETAVLSPSDC